MKYITSLKRFSGIIAVYLLLLVILLTTDPFRSPLLVVIVPFGLIFVALFMSFNSVLGRVVSAQKLSPKRRLFISGAAAWLPVMLLILRSIDQLTVRDSLILAVFIGALLLYVSRTNLAAR